MMGGIADYWVIVVVFTHNNVASLHIIYNFIYTRIRCFNKSRKISCHKVYSQSCLEKGFNKKLRYEI